jgi:diguanylate cyclase (GGDEF)-like protein
MIDIDHFKRINDRFGHSAGDRVLRRVAQTLKTHSRRYDVVGRWGGEEFALLLPSTPLDIARRVAERLRQAVAVLRFPDLSLTNEGEEQSSGGGGRVTISLGVASTAARQHSLTLEELISAADSALYRAKEQGRDRVCVRSAVP